MTTPDRSCRWRQYLLPAGVLALLAACAGTREGTPAAEVAAPPKPPSFATAAQRHQPLGVVAGSPATSREPVEPGASFVDAVAYARDMQSYALLIWADGALQLEQYFGEYDASLRPESASMHKTVLALTVAAAIEDGFLDGTTQPAATWLTEWAEDERRNIQLDHLLTMSSGLRPLSVAGGADSEMGRFFAGGSETRPMILGLEASTAPGQVFSYSNVDSQLLGLIVERATGQRYADYLATRIWQRLGANEALVWRNESDGFPRTYTALLATAQDWLKIGRLIKDQGRYDGDQIISGTLIDRMVAPSARNPGYGWQIWRGVDRVDRRYYNDKNTGLSVSQTEPFLIKDLIFLDGYGGQRVYISRERDLVIVRLGEMRLDWDDAQLPNRVVRALASD